MQQLTVTDVKALSKIFNKMCDEMAKPEGELGKLVKNVTVRAHGFATAITHVDTGVLRASHRFEVHGKQGRVFIDDTIEAMPNWSLYKSHRGKLTADMSGFWHGKKPSIYGFFENQRGGSHAFYARTVNEGGRGIVAAALVEFMADLERKYPGNA